jgi:hypothetical protein
MWNRRIEVFLSFRKSFLRVNLMLKEKNTLTKQERGSVLLKTTMKMKSKRSAGRILSNLSLNDE